MKLRATLALCATLMSTKVSGQPTTIHDNRLNSLSLSSRIGHGYSQLTNQVHASCLSNIEFTPSSSNLELSYISIKPNYTHQLFRRPSLDYSKLLQFLSENTIQPNKENSNRKRRVQQDKKSAQFLILLRFTFQPRAIIHNSIKIADGFRSSLSKGDFDQFFSHCGSHFISSASFVSYYAILLTYDSKNAKSDIQFESELSTDIKRFYPESNNTWLDKEIKKRRLRSSMQAVGLSNNSHENKLAVSINNSSEFRRLLNSAANKLRQQASGVASHAEISPWTELDDFISLSQNILPSELAFHSLKNLQSNAEIISKISNIENRFVDLEKKARLCYRALKEEYPIGSPPLGYDPLTTKFRNLWFPTEKQYQLSLKYFLDLFEKNKLIERILKEQKKFQSNHPLSGIYSRNCLSQLKKSKFYQDDYRTFTSCKGVLYYRFPQFTTVKQYCMPELTEVAHQINMKDH